MPHFAIACVAAFTGGRPAMISAATAAHSCRHGYHSLKNMVVISFRSRNLNGHSSDARSIKVLFWVMRFVSRSVIAAVNALAI